jgi:DNA-binding LacI/PurR family transcriptional regulator
MPTISKNPSLKQIAIECNLSVAAVSMALRGHQRVSKTTIKTVKAAAKRIGYRTNPLIRSVMSLVRFSQFSKKNWITIAFIWLEDTPESVAESNFLTKLIQSLIQRANSLGLNVEQFYLNNDGMTVQRLQKILIARGISGIIFSPSRQSSVVKLPFNWVKFTTVIIGHTPWEPEFNRVGHYQYSGMRRTLQNVFKAGYKKPALIIFENSNEQTLKSHESAFLAHYPDSKNGLKSIFHIAGDSDVLTALIYKTNYTCIDYAVGSYQGGLVDPIQTHAWDITWAVPDPRGVHNTMFSMNPISSTDDLETCFTVMPDEMPKRVMLEGKPSYDFPGKLLGGSRFEQVYQNLDTVIALYNIPVGTRFPHVNGFISKDLSHLVIDSSGWIFAQGGNTYLAYRPLAAYTLEPIARDKSWLPGDPFNFGDKRLYSPFLKNGTIMQAASVSEFKDFEIFKQRIRNLPFTFKLEPKPSVEITTLRGNYIKCVFGEAPYLNGHRVDYSEWKLFKGPYLNAEKNSHVLTITHGHLKRVLDFNTITTTDY